MDDVAEEGKDHSVGDVAEGKDFHGVAVAEHKDFHGVGRNKAAAVDHLGIKQTCST